MGHSHIDRRRHAFCYRRAKAGVAFRTIQKEEQARYGTANRPVSLSSLSRIVAIGNLGGDPNFAVAQGALSLLDWSPAAAFGPFAAFNLATILFVAWRMPETRGVPLDEIEREFEARAARSAGG